MQFRCPLRIDLVLRRQRRLYGVSVRLPNAEAWPLGEHPGTGPAALMTETPPFNITLINEAETYVFKSRSFPPTEQRHRIGLQKQLHIINVFSLEWPALCLTRG